MDLQRMLDKCRRDQWKVGDLDWDRPPREMSRDDEMAIVQYFTDMAAIERLAGALFTEQRKRVSDPHLKEIFRTFEIDEIRHAHAAQMLADYYDIHKYKAYQTNPHLAKFYPHFIKAIRYLSAEIANVYITGGELILDIALLRSINDFVDDDMSRQAMELINRDESRHIAIDFHMVEYYASDEYEKAQRDEPPPPFTQQLRAWWAFANVLYHAGPFFKEVFFQPMDLVDPSGKRMLEAFKRIQLLSTKPRVARRPFVAFMLTMQDLFRHPIVGAVFGRVFLRVMGTDPRVQVQLYTEGERRRAQTMTFDELAEEALAAKQFA